MVLNYIETYIFVWFQNARGYCMHVFLVSDIDIYLLHDV